MNSFTNRKKVRGWRKRVLALESWGKANAIPSAKILDYRGHDYVKLWIDPWYRLVRRNPPLWFFNLMLDELDQIYRQWDAYMQQQGQPYDLQIWVSHPDNMTSQVVVDVVEKVGEQRDNYFELLKEPLPFPEKKFSGKRHFNPNNYTWLSAQDYDYVYEKLDGLPKKEIDALIKKGYTAEVIKSETLDDTLYKKPTGKVWIGRLKR